MCARSLAQLSLPSLLLLALVAQSSFCVEGFVHSQGKKPRGHFNLDGLNTQRQHMPGQWWSWVRICFPRACGGYSKVVEENKCLKKVFRSLNRAGLCREGPINPALDGHSLACFWDNTGSSQMLFVFTAAAFLLQMPCGKSCHASKDQIFIFRV